MAMQRGRDAGTSGTGAVLPRLEQFMRGQQKTQNVCTVLFIPVPKAPAHMHANYKAHAFQLQTF